MRFFLLNHVGAHAYLHFNFHLNVVYFALCVCAFFVAARRGKIIHIHKYKCILIDFHVNMFINGRAYSFMTLIS